MRTMIERAAPNGEFQATCRGAGSSDLRHGMSRGVCHARAGRTRTGYGRRCAPGCDLYATTGTLTLPDARPCRSGVTRRAHARVGHLAGSGADRHRWNGGHVTLHNIDLPSATSLMIAGQPGVPDMTGVTAGNSKTYSFPASGSTSLKPGTYLYEAGLTADGPRQVAMGLYGALIVRPAGAPLQAYADPSTTFADEAVLVLSEIDPAFNAAPTTFDHEHVCAQVLADQRQGLPQYRPDHDGGGQQGAVALRQRRPAAPLDGPAGLASDDLSQPMDSLQPINPAVVAQTVPTGGTLDTIVTMPASRASEQRITPCSKLRCTWITRARRPAA